MNSVIPKHWNTRQPYKGIRSVLGAELEHLPKPSDESKASFRTAWILCYKTYKGKRGEKWEKTGHISYLWRWKSVNGQTGMEGRFLKFKTLNHVSISYSKQFLWKTPVLQRVMRRVDFTPHLKVMGLVTEVFFL